MFSEHCKWTASNLVLAILRDGNACMRRPHSRQHAIAGSYEKTHAGLARSSPWASKRELRYICNSYAAGDSLSRTTHSEPD